MIGLVLAERYELMEVIGDGGMSIVYKAKCHILNRFVAVKVLKKEFIDDAGFVERFEKEAMAAASIQHPNIVNIFDVGKQDAIHYIVMELVSAKTLKDYIKSQDIFLKNKQIIKVAIQIAEALQVAHDKGIVHRDIKPQNILMTEEGIAKVADFGIARAITSATIVNTNEAIGSVHYASPEQSRGGFVDKRSDIYSFGILLYELVTGRVPFEGDTPITVALKHLKEEVIPPSLINVHLNPSIEKMILKCVQKEPTNRYQNVYEIIERLEKLALDPDGEINFNDATSESMSQTRVLPKVVDYNKEALSGEDENNEGVARFITPKFIGAAIMGVVLAIIIIAIYFIGQFRSVNAQMPFELPDIKNMNFTEASTKLSEKGLYIEKDSEIHSETVATNHIITQSPLAGTMVKSGQKVLVVVSAGIKVNKLPNLQNLTLEQARVTLNNIDVSISEVEETHNDLPKGLIISQNPLAGTEIAEGDTVKLVISLGSKQKTIIMPNVIGRTKDEALRLLKENNLNYGSIDTQYDDIVPVDEVIEQSVDQGSEIQEETVVDLVISLGPKNPVTTVDPDVPITKPFYIPLPKDKEVYVIKVYKVVDGKEEMLYGKNHRREEERVDIKITGKGELHLRFYMDDVLIDDKIEVFE